MARKNKKKRRSAFTFPIPFAGVIVVLCTVGISFTWLDCRCDALGQEIRALEDKLSELEQERERQESRWSQMISTRGILQALAVNRVVMVWPRDHQVVRMFAQETVRRRELAGSRTHLADPTVWQGHIRHE